MARCCRAALRYILADDPGAGKTIMTGLFLKELRPRRPETPPDVCPGSLAEQWQDELFQKFHLHFEILPTTASNPLFPATFSTKPTSASFVGQNRPRRQPAGKLKVSEWDLIVCDEAHKMSATFWGGEIRYTKRFLLGRLLSTLSRHFLLLTATPHNGKEEDFQLFMSLIDQDRFGGVSRSSHQTVDVSDVMRRLVKEDLLKFDGRPLFPERRAYTVNYDLSPKEAALYTAVTNYVQEEFNRADNLTKERKNTVGFALTVLQRRLASSPEAIFQSLKRRRERLEARLSEEKLGKRALDFAIADLEDYDEDDLPSAELERDEEAVVDQASAAQTIAELEAEITTLRHLERVANDVRQSGEDRKWEELSRLLQDEDTMFSSARVREKLIIFTEHRDTLRYLADKIRSLLGDDQAVVTIHGGLLRDERRKVQEIFKQDKNARVLIATDAAGEGINLQRAHLMVNYDLPWNPNRIEQRFGRIHRIGQTEVCHLWNLVSKETREGLVFSVSLKIEQERETLQARFLTLGDISFDNCSLRDLLSKRSVTATTPSARPPHPRGRQSAGPRCPAQTNRGPCLTDDTMDVHMVMAIREEMERAEAHRLQPHFIEAFFSKPSAAWEGRSGPGKRSIRDHLCALYPARRDSQLGTRATILTKYERVCFERADRAAGKPLADLIAPGHPLLEAVIDLFGTQP